MVQVILMHWFSDSDRVAGDNMAYENMSHADDPSSLSDDSYTREEIEERLYSQVYHDTAGNRLRISCILTDS